MARGEKPRPRKKEDTLFHVLEDGQGASRYFGQFSSAEEAKDWAERSALLVENPNPLKVSPCFPSQEGDQVCADCGGTLSK